MGGAPEQWRKDDDASNPRPDPRISGGVIALNRRRKEGSRERLLAAAAVALCEHGYFGVSVEDIASAAGVSRMTFYRHFSGKAAVAAELFHINTGSAMPLLLSITQSDFRDPVIIRDWIAALFASDRASRQLLRVFTQASVSEPSFTVTAHGFIDGLIIGLGRAIPAFALAPDHAPDRRRWIEAWLLLYEILDQSNHAALDSGVATDPLTVDILAERFLAFTQAG